MKKIRITRPCVVEGKPRKVGDKFESKDADLLIGMGRAEEVPEKKKKAKKQG